jgi:hypothetical protein
MLRPKHFLCVLDNASCVKNRLSPICRRFNASCIPSFFNIILENFYEKRIANESNAVKDDWSWLIVSFLSDGKRSICYAQKKVLLFAGGW